MCEAIVEAGLSAKSGNTETIGKQMGPAAHVAVSCGTTFTDALGNMLRWNATRNLWRVCNYMASPKSIVLGFQKLAKALRCGVLWWYHFGYRDMPVERIHPSRRMLLPCKPPAFRCETLYCNSDSIGSCDKEPR